MASHSQGWGWSLWLDAWVTLTLPSIASAAQMQLKSSEPKCLPWKGGQNKVGKGRSEN